MKAPVGDSPYPGGTLTSQTKYDYVKGQNSYGLNTKLYHKPYKKHLDASVKERPKTLLVPSEQIY